MKIRVAAGLYTRASTWQEKSFRHADHSLSRRSSRFAESILIELRQSTPKEQIEKYLRINARTDAIHYIRHAALTPLLFQFARYERYFNEAAMVRYAQAAGEPKLVKWYETGHDLNDVQALVDRADWLQGRIATKSITPILERKLKRK